MTEPTGHTIDGTPWEEPRPPHLPARLTSITPLVLPFLLVAAYQVWALWVEQPPQITLSARLDYWIAARHEFAAIAASVLGAALFFRHPDARSTLPQMASGVFLLLIAQFMDLATPILDPLFVTFDAPSDLAYYSALAQAYSLLTSLVSAFGLVYLARGLSAARRHEDVVSVRSLAVPLVVIAVVSSAITHIGWVGGALGVSTEFVSSAFVAQFAASWVIGLVGTLAWSYLFVVAIVGWLGHEPPRLGWRLAALGAGLALLARLLAPITALMSTWPELLFRVFDTLAMAALFGWVLLVVALVVGLPSTESDPDAAEGGPTLDPPGATQPGSAAG
jgi:hypothetical protein